jgi:hypothetical protein
MVNCVALTNGYSFVDSNDVVCQSVEHVSPTLTFSDEQDNLIAAPSNKL